MEAKHFLAYDVGTSGVKSIIIDEKGVVKASAVEPYPLQMPKPGWVEQYPDDYWSAICKATKSMMKISGVDPYTLKGIVFSTQAMGIVPISRSGEILYPNISWVDGRAEEQATKAMRIFMGKRVFKALVGIEITGKDVIPKLMWLKEKKPEIWAQTEKILDVNGFLKFKCTGKKVAEWSGACSYAFDLKKKDWERIFYKLTKIGVDKLPDLVRSIDNVGPLTTAAASDMGLVSGIPVFGGCDDTQSASVGSGAIGEGEAHIYLGTAAQVTVSTSRNIKFKNGAVCLQSADPNKNLVVGVTESAGVNIDWILDQFYKHEKQHHSDAEVFSIFEKEIKEVPAGSDHLIFTPWFLGERCPVSTTTTRATLFNLSHEHTRGHMARAHCEGIAYNIRWTIENMERDFGFKIPSLRIIGGGSQNDTWMQIAADVTKREIVTTNEPRLAGAIGVSMCAMVGSGTYSSFEDIHQLIQPKKEYTPNVKNAVIYDQLFLSYKDIYKALKKPYMRANSKRFTTN